MSRKLTSPLVPAGPGPAIEQNIPRVSIDLGWVANPDADGAVLDLTKTAITYDVADVGAGGFPVDHKPKTVFHSDWPAPVVTAVKRILAWSETHAESEGVMKPGVSSEDL